MKREVGKVELFWLFTFDEIKIFFLSFLVKSSNKFGLLVKF